MRQFLLKETYNIHNPAETEKMKYLYINPVLVRSCEKTCRNIFVSCNYYLKMNYHDNN